MNRTNLIFSILGLIILSAFIVMTFMQFGATPEAYSLTIIYIVCAAVYTADAIMWESLYK